MNDTVVAIVSAFFVIGILVGIIVVVAMSVLRAESLSAPSDPGDLLDYERREPPGLPWDDSGPDGHPRWPGDAGNDFGGR
jgi:hypothetical protein